MMMFLLGVIITWTVLSFVYIISDLQDRQDIGYTVVGLPFIFIDNTIEFIIDTCKVIKVLDLCIKYHIPVFKRMSFETLKEKLDDKGKEKWVQRMPKEQQERWKKAFDI